VHANFKRNECDVHAVLYGDTCEKYAPTYAESDEQAATRCTQEGKNGYRVGSAKHTCYVCGNSEGLRECKHCGSTVCKDSLYAGELCPLCAAMKSNMAQDAQRRLARRNEEVERASELAARASALVGYDAGVTAAIMQIEDRAKRAPGLAGDVLLAMARELADSIKPGVRHV
jgi:hypothetical protein